MRKCAEKCLTNVMMLLFYTILGGKVHPCPPPQLDKTLMHVRSGHGLMAGGSDRKKGRKAHKVWIKTLWSIIMYMYVKGFESLIFPSVV